MFAGVHPRRRERSFQVHLKLIAMLFQQEQIGRYAIVFPKWRMRQAVSFDVAQLNFLYGERVVRVPKNGKLAFRQK